MRAVFRSRLGSFSRVASMARSPPYSLRRTSSLSYPTARSRTVAGSFRVRSMRTYTPPVASISNSSHAPRVGITVAAGNRRPLLSVRKL